MSATGRSAAEPVRHLNDFYCTPSWCTKLILEKMGIPPAARCTILDPGCGSGAIFKAIREHAPNIKTIGVEFDEVLAREASKWGDVLVEDYLARTWSVDNVDIIVSNPPYETDTCSALDFVLRSLEIAPIVAKLLRVPWLEGAREREPARLELLQKNPPWVGMLSRRPSFCTVVKSCTKCNATGQVILADSTAYTPTMYTKCKRCNGKGETKTTTDGTSYGWFVWGHPHLEAGRYEVLTCPDGD